MKTPRMTWTAVVAIATFAGVVVVHPQQAMIVLLKLNILAMAAWLGYWLDRELFPYARPHTLPERMDPMLRRSIIIGSAMIGASLAL